MNAAQQPPTDDVVKCPHCKGEGVLRLTVYSGQSAGRIGVKSPIGCGYCHRSGYVGGERLEGYNGYA